MIIAYNERGFSVEKLLTMRASSVGTSLSN